MGTQPLRVAIVGAYPLVPGAIAGGISAVTFQLVQALRGRTDVQVSVVHCHANVPADRTVRDGNVTVYYLALPRQRVIPNMITGVGRIARLLRDLQPDVVNAHGHSYAVAAAEAGYAGTRSPVWTIHGAIAEEARYNPGLFNRLAFGLAGYYERRALALVREITAISPYIQERFAGRTRARWHLVENPAPADMFGLDRQPVPGRLLLAASVTPRKDLITLVRSLALARRDLPALHLQVAGRVDDAAYVAKVQAACAASGVADRVEFLGVQGRDQMRRLYSEAQLVVLSSREEVSPMSAIEALAAGIPVVTTRAGGAGYIVDDGQTGRVVDVGDAPAFAAAIRQVLTDPILYGAMSAHAQAVATQRFHPQRVAERYLEVYRLAWETAMSGAQTR